MYTGKTNVIGIFRFQILGSYLDIKWLSIKIRLYKSYDKLHDPE